VAIPQNLSGFPPKWPSRSSTTPTCEFVDEILLVDCRTTRSRRRLVPGPWQFRISADANPPLPFRFLQFGHRAIGPVIRDSAGDHIHKSQRRYAGCKRWCFNGDNLAHASSSSRYSRYRCPAPADSVTFAAWLKGNASGRIMAYLKSNRHGRSLGDHQSNVDNGNVREDKVRRGAEKAASILPGVFFTFPLVAPQGGQRHDSGETPASSAAHQPSRADRG
jgi:hypothetical protein